MLGDTAVAVHPDDERYRARRQAPAILPLAEPRDPGHRRRLRRPGLRHRRREGDPGARPNDFEMGQRHHLPRINVMTRRRR
jgi:valyl-tRNA synthetase